MNRKTCSWLIVLLFLVFLIALCVFIAGQFENKQVKAGEINLEQLVLPVNDGNIIQHSGFTLCYSEENEQPLWVAYVLTPDEVNAPSIKRKDNFRADPYVLTGSAELSDYKGSGYDRGHLAPYADLSWSEESANDSFYLSNMSPQNSSFNRGKWAELESLVRSFSKTEPMCVVTGPVLTDGPFESIGKNNVSVPHYFFKVILDYVGNEIKAIGFILPNEKCNDNLVSYVVSVDQVEHITGLDFFSLLPDDIEEKLESNANSSLWF